MIKKCLVCESEFKTYPSKVSRGRGKYCSKKCSHSITDKKLSKNNKSRFKKGNKPWNYRGFCFSQPRKEGKMYKLVLMKDHPFCDSKGYVREHRLVMEQKIGRYLTPQEIVHHINHDTLDNRVENLEIMTWKEHRKEHLKDNIHKRWQKE